VTRVPDGKARVETFREGFTGKRGADTWGLTVRWNYVEELFFDSIKTSHSISCDSNSSTFPGFTDGNGCSSMRLFLHLSDDNYHVMQRQQAGVLMGQGITTSWLHSMYNQDSLFPVFRRPRQKIPRRWGERDRHREEKG
jgi:hypothetical protein